VRKEPNPTALTSETQFVHGPTLGCHGCRPIQVDQITRLGALVSLAEALNHLQVGLPLSSQRKIADTSHRWRVVHVAVLLSRATGSVFSCLPEETMKFKLKTRDYWLIGALLAVALLFGLLSVPGTAYDAEVAKDVESDRARFSPTNSLDIAMAMKLVTHDPPKSLAPPQPNPVTLLYPPSAEDLEKLSGPQ